MKTTKLETGTYKVEIGNSIVYIVNEKHSWEAYNGINEIDGFTNSWACGAPNKKTLLKWIQEEHDNGNLA